MNEHVKCFVSLKSSGYSLNKVINEDVFVKCSCFVFVFVTFVDRYGFIFSSQKYWDFHYYDCSSIKCRIVSVLVIVILEYFSLALVLLIFFYWLCILLSLLFQSCKFEQIFILGI